MLEDNALEIPKELLDLINAEDTALEITRICFENGVKEDEKIREISYQTGRVLLGDLPPKEFQKSLEEKIEISSLLASKISREINESIFFPVKEDLTTLYGSEVLPPEKPTTSSPKITEEKSEEIKRERKDTYREPIE